MFPVTVNALYEWGAWRKSREFNPRRANTKHPTVAPMFLEADGVYQDEDPRYEFNPSLAENTDKIIWSVCSIGESGLLVSYYSRLESYQEIALSLEGYKLYGRSITPKLAKEWIGHAVIRVDTMTDLLTKGLAKLPVIEA